MSHLASSLIESFYHRLPKNVWVLVSLLVCGSLAYPAVLLGPLVSRLLPKSRWPYAWVSGGCLLFIMCFLWFDERSVTAYFFDNAVYLMLLLSQHTVVWQDLTWDVLVLMNSCLFGHVIAFLRSGNPLAQALAQVSQGQSGKSDFVSVRVVSRQLSKLSAVAQDGCYLGVSRETGQPVQLTDQQANTHTLAIGTTGSGKTTGLCNIIESAILRRLPVYIVDGKGDVNLARRIERFAKRQQVKCYVFSMVGDSVVYNPIADGGITSKKDRLIAMREWSEPFYQKIAEGYLQNVFHILEKSRVSVDLHTLGQYLDPKVLAVLVQPLQDADLSERVRRMMKQVEHIRGLVADIENLTKSELVGCLIAAVHPH